MEPQQNPQEPFQQPKITPMNEPTSSIFDGKSGRDKTMLFIVVAAIIIVVATIAAVLVMASGDTEQPAESQGTTQDEQALVSPPSRLEIENLSAAINQEISTLNNEEDFPEDYFSDKALGL